MVQTQTTGTVDRYVVASTAPTLAEIEVFARDEVTLHLLPRFWTEDAVRRFCQVYSVNGRLVVSAAIEAEAVALAEYVVSTLRGRFGIGVEARVHQNPNPWIRPSQRGVFFTPSAVSARRFAVHLDVSPAA